MWLMYFTHILLACEQFFFLSKLKNMKWNICEDFEPISWFFKVCFNWKTPINLLSLSWCWTTFYFHNTSILKHTYSVWILQTVNLCGSISITPKVCVFYTKNCVNFMILTGFVWKNSIRKLQCTGKKIWKFQSKKIQKKTQFLYITSGGIDRI
jgi:hypothetical protein